VDISAQLELSRALLRWPLLADFQISNERTQKLPAVQSVQKNRFGAQK
jgi:hypothetical protein